MNRKILQVSMIIVGISMASCFWSMDSGTDQIIGKYYVIWIDLKENQGIAEKIEESEGSYIDHIPEYVFAVGHNNNFIIAKQHPTSGLKSGYQIDTEITNYFILDMNTQKDKVIGPLAVSEFEQIRKELGISDIKFDMNYPESYD